MKHVIVIRIGDQFLGPDYVNNRSGEHGEIIGPPDARTCLVPLASMAYAWRHEYYACRCAHFLSRNELRGYVVAVERHAIFDGPDIFRAPSDKLGDVSIDVSEVRDDKSRN